MTRKLALVLLVLGVAATLLVSPASAQRAFPETGYTVSNAAFLDYFDKRGGVDTLGYPVSREFDLLGTRVQFFQRGILQSQPGGGVGLMNLLSADLLPYTEINGSTFPAADPALLAAAPSPAGPGYADEALAFVRAFAPDEWEGMRVNFFSTFSSTVTLADAFPTGGGDEALLPLLNLEIWGLPTSRPMRDPANAGFVYLRFQRGIMHYDSATGLTQGILLADHLKSVITGVGMPADLAVQAAGSALYRQYDNSRPGGMVRPEQLPGTNLFSAFERDGVVVPTPAPVVPTPVPTLAPVPPTATPVQPAASTPVPPAQVAPPASIAVVGSPWFVDQTNMALRLLAANAPDYYPGIRNSVFRIEEAAGQSSYDVASRTLKVTEATAFPPDWRSFRDNQIEWYAGLIVHNATHIEQALTGRPNTGYEAEQEARRRQLVILDRVDSSEDPGNQLFNYVRDVVEGRVFEFGDWEFPREPENP